MPGQPECQQQAAAGCRILLVPDGSATAGLRLSKTRRSQWSKIAG
jgi:hypothetical protein